VKLHIPSKRPDWDQGPKRQRNAWQTIAAKSQGVATPGNALSILGLALVAWGSARLYAGAWVASLLLIIAGRLFDVADGYVADLTKTKSLLGEAIDTTCDKTSVFLVVIVAFSIHALNPLLLAIVVLHQLYIGTFGFFWGQEYGLHTNQYGKLSMLVGWVAIVTDLISQHLGHNPLAYCVGLLTALTYVYLAAMSILTYHRELTSAMAKAAR
jgi:phosphatidylglycerophosphate synthase